MGRRKDAQDRLSACQVGKVFSTRWPNAHFLQRPQDPEGAFKLSNEGLGEKLRGMAYSPGISGYGWMAGQLLFLLNCQGFLDSGSPFSTKDLFRSPYPAEDQEL